jgi:hypothetical protein
MGLIVAGAASSGGLAALAVKVALKRNDAGKVLPDSDERKNQNANQND